MDKQSAPVLRYSRGHEAEDAAEAALVAHPQVSKLNEAFTRAVLGVCLLAWAVIGFFLWIPKIVRGVVAFSAALVQSTLAETSAEAAGRALRSAANFYRRGFVSAVDAIRPRAEVEHTDEKPVASEGIEPGLIVRETAWAFVVWYVILWPMGVFRGTAADIAMIPWGELWATAVLAVGSIPELFSR